MAYCTNCGAALGAGRRYCGSCGAAANQPMRQPAQPVTTQRPQRGAGFYIAVVLGIAFGLYALFYWVIPFIEGFMAGLTGSY
jgi:hypothetical protein